MTYSWGNTRRFNAASDYFKKNFGTRVQKLTIDAGFTCPNRDGTISTGGCTFCNNDAFNPSYCNPEKTITQQLTEGIIFHETRYRSAQSYLAYFQAYSNTYGTVNHLAGLYNEAINFPNVAGLIIGTRPDCINSEILDLLEEISSKKYLVVEFGIESIYDKTLERVNRGHTYNDFLKALDACCKRNLKCGGHYIFGLPGETKEMMLNSVNEISKLPLHTIKFHQLQIIRNTKMAEEYSNNPQNFNLFTLDEYIDFIIQYIEKLSPKLIIDRFAGETQPRNNAGIKWKPRYDQVLQKIEKKMIEMDTWQGKFYQSN